MKLKLSITDMQDSARMGQEYHVDAMFNEAKKVLKQGGTVEIENTVAGTTKTIQSESELEEIQKRIKDI